MCCCAAAYGARTKLNWYPKDNKINVHGESSWDYSHLPGLAYSKIHAPEGAPSWVFDREQLWNKAEEAEKRKDSQTARRFMIALQIELTLEQNIALTEDIVSELVDMGMVVDTNIHTDKIHNPHAHLLATTRELKENRYGEIEFSKLKNREWGRGEPWFRAIREMVAGKINKHFALAGLDVRVTHESYETLGIDLEPTHHEGPARNIKNAELVALNKEVLERNAQKVRENPSLILDKLAINKPVFTKEEIAIEIEKVLSYEIIGASAVDFVMDGVSDESNNDSAQISKKSSSDMELLNQEMTTKYMEIYTKIMSSSELSLVLEEDLKGRTLYTTTKRLEMEQRYISTVEQLKNSNLHSLSLTDSDLDQLSFKENITNAALSIATDFASILEKKTGIKFSLPGQNRELSQEQRDAVLGILNGPDIGVVEGIPGAGKTVAMREIVRQCQKAGKIVIGVTPSSAAALVLAKETGIECKNASLWRKEWLNAKGKKFELALKGDYYKEDKYQNDWQTNILSGLFLSKCLTKNHVMIIDEASMVELSNMDYLLSEAARVGAKVIKVCDNNQLHAVGWLGAAKKTIDICGSYRLEESRRQQNPLHQEATKLLGSFKVREALEIYMKEGSIIIEDNELKTRNKLMHDYIDSYIAKAKLLDKEDLASVRTQVISTYTNKSAESLNKEIRIALRDAGIIKGKQYKINVGDKNINLAKGEQIVFTRNFNRLGRSGIYNGEVGTIVDMSKPDRFGNSMVAVIVSKADGSKEGVIIDTEKLTEYGPARLFDYGYAVTAHKLQGGSVDLNFIYFEENMGYEALNVLLTRHREFVRMYVDRELLEGVIYESLDKNKVKAALRYDLEGGERILNGLVKFTTKRVNSSFAVDYKDMGLTDEDKHLKAYMEAVHEAVEVIRGISMWRSQEWRRTGHKPNLWDHEDWGKFKMIRGCRNDLAKGIVENYPKFKDRIIQIQMNYETIEKHASEGEDKIHYGLVEEYNSVLYMHSGFYKKLVAAIDDLDITATKKAYNNLRLEIAENYTRVEKAINDRIELKNSEEEIRSEIESELYYRDVLIKEYLSRIYKDSPEKVLEKYEKLCDEEGYTKAAELIGHSPEMLGTLKGIGIGRILSIGKARKDVVATSERLEKSLLSYSRSCEMERNYEAELEEGGFAAQIKKLDEEIEKLRSQLPISIDEKFIDEVGSVISRCSGGGYANSDSKSYGKSNSNSDNNKNTKSTKSVKNAQKEYLEELKGSSLFQAIKLGLYREEVSRDRKILEREYNNENSAEHDNVVHKDAEHNIFRGEGGARNGINDNISDKTAQIKEETKAEIKKENKNKNFSIGKYKKAQEVSLKFEDVKNALNPSVIEAIFREYAPRINPDGALNKQGTQISCGSLSINLNKGLWYRFSNGSKGDIFTLVSEATGGSKRDALEIVAGFAGVRKSELNYGNSNQPHYDNQNSKDIGEQIKSQNQIQHQEQKVDAWNPYSIVPQEAEAFEPKKALSFMISRGLKVTNTYEYKNRVGELIGYTIRVEDSATGKKQVLPVAYCFNEASDKSRWQLKGVLDEGYKPIYKADVLREDPMKPVLIVEGEKTADRASELFPEYNVISWMGGAQGVHKVDWSQVKDREVVIWPDSDAPGKMAAGKITAEIDNVNGFSGLVRIVDVEKLGLEEKWDLADKIPDHLSLERLKEAASDALRTQVKISKLLEAKVAEMNPQEKVLTGALEMLITTGRLDKDEVASNGTYISTLAAIAVSKTIDLDNSKNFVDDVRDLQDIYQSISKKYEFKNHTVSGVPGNNGNISKKDQIKLDITREVAILHQVMLGIDELPKSHKELIAQTANDIVLQVTKGDFIDKEHAGSKMYQKISTKEWGEKLDHENKTLIDLTKDTRHNMRLENIKSNIEAQKDYFEKIEKLGFGFTREEEEGLTKDLMNVPYGNHKDHILKRIVQKFEKYLGAKLKPFSEAKEDAKTIAGVMNVIEQEQNFKVDIYKNHKELVDLALNSLDKSNNPDKGEMKHTPSLEDAHIAVQENAIHKLQKSINYASKHNILSDEVIIKRLQESPGTILLEREISKSCVYANGKMIKDHLSSIESGQRIKFEGHKFDNSEEYLDYWKHSRAHHLIPIHEINKSLVQIRHMTKEHEMCGPSL